MLTILNRDENFTTTGTGRYAVTMLKFLNKIKFNPFDIVSLFILLYVLYINFN